MAGPGFQQDGSSASTGVFGTDPFGTSAFGGTEYQPYELPELQVPSDDLTDTTRRFAARIQHKRHGVIVGQRHIETRQRWTVHLSAVGRDVIEALQEYFDSGYFRLLPDADASSNYTPVYWVETEFEPKRLRGPYWEITFTLEEAS